MNAARAATSMLAPLAVGLGSAAATRNITVSFYSELAKPSWAPPPWLFGPVWTLLYLTMGLALYLAWSAGAKTRARRVAIGLFALQLALNAAWSPVFFGARKPALALAVLAGLWLAIVATAAAFRPLSRVAAALLLPYLAWVSFAGALNASIVAKNPALAQP